MHTDTTRVGQDQGTITFDTRGIHAQADLWGCSFEVLDDMNRVRSLMLEAARKAQMTVLGEVSHKFEPQGCAVILLLAESHASIHTYPESGYTAVDVFTCGEGDSEVALEYIVEELRPTHYTSWSVERGHGEVPEIEE